MIKREIKEFKLCCDGVSEYPVSVPFTLYSAMCELGRAERKNTSIGKCTIEAAKLSSAFSVDENLFCGKFSYLRICGVQAAAEVYVNGTSVGSLDGIKRKDHIDVSSALVNGENILELVFSEPEWNAGFIQSVELLNFNFAIIDSVLVSQCEEEGAVNLDITLGILGGADGARAVATLISGAGQIYYGGFNNGVARVTVRDPLYWWPGSLGLHNVYKLSVNLYGDMEVEDSLELKVGFRTSAVNRESGGVLIDVNRVPFVPMGAVYVPDKNYLPEESKRRTAAFVTSSAMAGFNTFVIRNTDNLPSDEFFDLCDVHGIAVIFEPTCASESVIDSISRLAHHPSFVQVDAVGLGEEFCEKLSDTAKTLAVAVFDKAPEYFGEYSIPSDKTLFPLVERSRRNIFSDTMEAFSGGHNKEMVSAVFENFLYAWNISDLAYLTRLSQAENCRKRAEEARAAFGRCGRAVFSSVSADDLISDSSMDPNVNWKALHYRASKFFSPVLISAAVSGTSVTFTASNSGKTAVFGKLEYRIIDSSNLVIYKNSEEIDVAEHSSRELFTRDFAEHMESHECDRYIEYIFSEGSHILYRGVTLFTAPKRFAYEKPNIKTEILGQDKRFYITVSADKYVRGLELDFENEYAVFSDNYFDITSEMPVKVTFTVNDPAETVKSLTKQLKIRSLYDVGRTD